MAETDQAEIRRRYDWHDQTQYQWTISKPDRDIWYFMGALVGGTIIFPVLVFAVPWLVHFVWHSGAFWLGFLITAVMILVLLVQLNTLWSGSSEERIEARSILYWVAIIGAFGLVYSSATHGSFLRDGFRGRTQSTWQWVLYFGDNILRVVLLDVPEIWEFQLSSISPEDWYARLVTVMLRIFIAAGFVELALSARRVELGEQEVFATVKEAFYMVDGLPTGAEDYELRQVGTISPLAEPVVIDAQAFMAAFKADKETDAAAAAAGAAATGAAATDSVPPPESVSPPDQPV
jgi:hypothetical protein